MKPFKRHLLTLGLLVAFNTALPMAWPAPVGDSSVQSSRDGRGKPAVSQHYNIGSDKVALSGYDPVSYFNTTGPLKGRKDLNAEHRGVKYFFASDAHRTLFMDSPEKFVPAYGGWCATAMAKGEKVEIDPTNFKVTDGRLFLFFKAFYGNALKDWNKDEANLTTKADSNWKRITGE